MKFTDSLYIKKINIFTRTIVIVSTFFCHHFSYAETSVYNHVWGGGSGYSESILADHIGNVYVADRESNTVIKITPDGNASIYATTGIYPLDMTMDVEGNIYTANYASNNVTKITPDGDSIIYGDTGLNPHYIGIDSEGNVYTSNVGSIYESDKSITKINSDGSVDTISGTDQGLVMTVDTNGNIYTMKSGRYFSTIKKIIPDGGDIVYQLEYPYSSNVSLDADSMGNLYTTSDVGNNIIKIANDGTISTLDIGLLPYGTWSNPSGPYPYLISIDDQDNIYTMISDGRIIRTTSDGASRIFGNVSASWISAIALDSNGNVYALDPTDGIVFKITPDTIPPTLENSVLEENISQGESYSHLNNISCLDNLQGDCTSLISVSGSVDTSVVGDYTLTYSFTDGGGNVSNTVQRIVHVVPLLDLSLTQTLTTTGMIHAGDTVNYEFKITNLSESVFRIVNREDIQLVAVIPDALDLGVSILSGGTMTGLVDKVDRSDMLCANYEGIQYQNEISGVAYGGYESTNIMLCGYYGQETAIPAGGTFIWNLTTTALADMEVGTTSHSVLVAARENDIYTIFGGLGSQSMFSHNTNNNAISVYNPNMPPHQEDGESSHPSAGPGGPTSISSPGNSGLDAVSSSRDKDTIETHKSTQESNQNPMSKTTTKIKIQLKKNIKKVNETNRPLIPSVFYKVYGEVFTILGTLR